jgi:hypothetical protein
MRIRSRLSHVVLAGAALSIAACSDATSPTESRVPGAISADRVDGSGRVGGNPALSFNGSNANTSTPQGTVATTQVQDMVLDVMVRYDGPNAANAHQTIFYNGNGGLSGWGILVLGTADGAAPGTLAFLSGGVTIAQTSFVLTPGKWQHLTVERSFPQRTTIALDDQAVDLGNIPVNAVGGAHAALEHTSVGGDGISSAPNGDFNGAIDDVRITDLVTHSVIEAWSFDEGRGTTTLGVNGAVLQLGNTTWTRDDNKVEAGEGNPSLLFDGLSATTSTPSGTVFTTQTDNMSVEASFTYEGPNTANAHQTLFYNGNGAVSGWGILILDAADGALPGTVAFLSGGVTVAATPFVLAPRRRSHIRVTRDAAGDVKVYVNGDSVDLGGIGVHPVQQGTADHTAVGGDGTFGAPTGTFNGTISDLRVRDIGTGGTIEHWRFDEGSGAITTGDRGTILFLGKTQWTSHKRGLGPDGDHGGHGR